MREGVMMIVMIFFLQNPELRTLNRDKRIDHGTHFARTNNIPISHFPFINIVSGFISHWLLKPKSKSFRGNSVRGDYYEASMNFCKDDMSCIEPEGVSPNIKWYCRGQGFEGYPTIVLKEKIMMEFQVLPRSATVPTRLFV
jgi:hypothetical protein